MMTCSDADCEGWGKCPCRKWPKVSTVRNMMAATAHEMKLIMESYTGYPCCRIDYTPDHIDSVITDLIELKNLWKEELKKGVSVVK